MLFLDTSVFVKVYFKEVGSEAIIARCTAPNQLLAASVLSFAEVHSAMGRMYRAKQISSLELSRLRASFEGDWDTSVHVVELNPQTMAKIVDIVEQYPLKAADAVQLSAVLWLKDNMSPGTYSGAGEDLEFAVSDRILAQSARRCGLTVFNPEDED